MHPHKMTQRHPKSCTDQLASFRKHYMQIPHRNSKSILHLLIKYLSRLPRRERQIEIKRYPREHTAELNERQDSAYATVRSYIITN
jgi:hypothetical protein